MSSSYLKQSSRGKTHFEAEKDEMRNLTLRETVPEVAHEESYALNNAVGEHLVTKFILPDDEMSPKAMNPHGHACASGTHLLPGRNDVLFPRILTTSVMPEGLPNVHSDSSISDGLREAQLAKSIKGDFYYWVNTRRFFGRSEFIILLISPPSSRFTWLSATRVKNHGMEATTS